MVGCAEEEDKGRRAYEDTYPSEYAEAICTVQVECGFVTDLESCRTDLENRWVDKLRLGCFDEFAAIECLDTLESITCAGYEGNAWSMCADVDECT